MRPLNRRLRIGVLFGGQSAEHAVSLMSGQAIMDALATRHQVVPIGISKSGQFLPGVDVRAALAGSGQLVETTTALAPSAAVAGLDVVVVALHGPMGEDGTVQGLLELAGIPYVGSGVLGSAVAMDKAMMKGAFATAGLPVGPWRLLRHAEWLAGPDQALAKLENFQLPVFVKPANMGSSVGISRVDSWAELSPAIERAFAHDRRVVVEEGLAARELECGVIGNDRPQASVVGEVVSHRAFYDYEAKYQADGADLLIPADLGPEVASRARQLAVQAFLAVDAAGLARVDMFLVGDQLYVNEINTLPGFTPYSMFPRLWQASGLDYPTLLDRLIDYALERHARTRSDAQRGDP
ncbi:MAG: D-alanine--D-alanine ligase family protein [Sulfobacillus sp.]